MPKAVLSVLRFEVGVSLLLAPTDKKGPKAQGPFSYSGQCKNIARDSQEVTRQSSGRSQVLLKALSKVQITFLCLQSFLPGELFEYRRREGFFKACLKSGE